MMNKPETETPADLVKKQQAMEQQERDLSNKKPPPGEVPAGNPREHPRRQTR